MSHQRNNKGRTSLRNLTSRFVRRVLDSSRRTVAWFKEHLESVFDAFRHAIKWLGKRLESAFDAFRHAIKWLGNRVARLSGWLSKWAIRPLSSLSLGETFALMASIVALVPVSIWLDLSSGIYRDQSHIQMLDMLVNQSYGDEAKTPLCVYGGEESRTFVVCDTTIRVAVDEYENGRVAVRRFYDEGGTALLAIDRYEYVPPQRTPQRKVRVIFRRVLFIFQCGYLEDTFSASGILISKRIDRLCSGERVEIPSQSFFASPPPVVLFLPYR